MTFADKVTSAGPEPGEAEAAQAQCCPLGKQTACELTVLSVSKGGS